MLKIVFRVSLCLLVVGSTAFAEEKPGRYSLAEVRDAATLETRVVEDWQPWGAGAKTRRKLIEITVCEWWPGQKVRLPITLIAPATGTYPQVFVVKHPQARIAGLTLGHDALAHDLPEFKTLSVNCIEWVKK